MNWKALILSVALVFGTAGVALAGQTSTQSKTTTSTTTTNNTKMAVHHEMGTIASLTASDLILSHKYNGKQESTTFMLNPSTKKQGTIDKGARVEVYYKFENHQRIATEVKSEGTKS